MVIILKTIYLVKHSGPFVDIKNYEDYENVLWEDYNRNMILSVDGEKRAEKLCEIEELNNVEPQHIFTNMLAGNLLCTGVSNLLEKKVTPGCAYFNSHTYSSSFIAYCG